MSAREKALARFATTVAVLDAARKMLESSVDGSEAQWHAIEVQVARIATASGSAVQAMGDVWLPPTTERAS